MAARHDTTPWDNPAENQWLADRLKEGWTVPKMVANWPPQFPKRNRNQVNNRKAAIGLYVNKGVTPEADPEQVVDVQDNGDALTIRAAGTRIKTLDDLLAHVKADLTTFEVDKPTFRKNEQVVRDHTGKLNLVEYFHVSCTLKRKAGPSAVEQVEAMVAGAFAGRKIHTAKLVNTAKLQPDTMQAIVIADPHIAKHAWGRETGHGDYDIPISVKLLREAATEQITYGNAHGIGKRYLFLLGDVLHYDTPNGSTTGGTALERDGRVEKMLEEATRALFDIIEHSAQTHPTEVVMVGGNHDALLSVALRHILFAYFRNDKRVSIEMGATTRKYLTWGKCLIGLTHGDKAQKSLGELMAVEARKEWGDALLRDIHHGHRHSEAMVTTKGGVTIRQHPALCPPDGWHAAEGYVGAPRGLDSYFYHKDGYLRGTLRSAVLDG